MSSAAPSSTLLGIGDVIAALRTDFPDVTISKIRFLESEGLVEPQRTASGYRKFVEADVDRLRFILAAQRDQYLPLKVIREHLAEADRRGLMPEPIRSESPSPTKRAAGSRGGVSDGSDGALTNSDELNGESRMSRHELLETAKLKESQLASLESYGLVTSRDGSQFDATAILIARTISDMMAFGIEPRHLRSFKVAADREVGLMAQVMTPLLKSRTAESRASAAAKIRDLAELSSQLHSALVKAGLDQDVLH